MALGGNPHEGHQMGHPVCIPPWGLWEELEKKKASCRVAWGGWGSSGSSLLLSTLRASTPVSGTSLWLRETHKCRNVMCRRTRDNITFWTKTEVTGWCKQTNLMYEWIVREPWWSRYRASVLAVDVVDWWRLGHFGPARTLSSSPSCSRRCQSHYKIW